MALLGPPWFWLGFTFKRRFNNKEIHQKCPKDLGGKMSVPRVNNLPIPGPDVNKLCLSIVYETAVSSYPRRKAISQRGKPWLNLKELLPTQLLLKPYSCCLQFNLPPVQPLSWKCRLLTEKQPAPWASGPSHNLLQLNANSVILCVRKHYFTTNSLISMKQFCKQSIAQTGR